MSSADSARLTGRAPDPSKDVAILEAARSAFFQHGFAGVTIEDVASRASVSKVTIYKRFQDKDGLFEAVVRHQMRHMEAEVERWPFADGGLAERLNAFGSILLRFLFSSDHMLLDRMLARDLSQSPDMARRFFDAGPGYCRDRLTRMIDEASTAGEVVVDDPRLAAGDLFSLWSGFLQKELDFHIVARPTAAEIDARVRRGTRLFLRMVAPKRHEGR